MKGGSRRERFVEEIALFELGLDKEKTHHPAKSTHKGSRIQGRFGKHLVAWLSGNRVDIKRSGVTEWESKMEPDHGRPKLFALHRDVV